MIHRLFRISGAYVSPADYLQLVVEIVHTNPELPVYLDVAIIEVTPYL